MNFNKKNVLFKLCIYCDTKKPDFEFRYGAKQCRSCVNARKKISVDAIKRKEDFYAGLGK